MFALNLLRVYMKIQDDIIWFWKFYILSAGFVSVPLQLPSNVSFGSAIQDNTERGQDNPKTSINRPLIYHNNDTYLYEAHVR